MNQSQRHQRLDAIETWADALDFSVTLIGGENRHEFMDAVLGVQESPPAVVYDYNRVVEALRRTNPGWSRAEALEWMETQTLPAVRCIPSDENPPVVVTPIEELP